MTVRSQRSAGAGQPRSHRPGRARPTFVQRNRTNLLVGLAGVVIVAVLAILVLIAGKSPQGETSAAPADPALIDTVTHLPAATFDAVGTGSVSNPPAPITAPSLTIDGKPEVLYVGGEFCPYCAAERWAMVLALSRFGSFSNLQTTRSAAADVYPSTPTFSFYGSTYQSDYLSFVPVEQFSSQRSGSGYATLQPLTGDQQAVVNAYDSGGSIPFVDFGGKYALSGATFNPGLLGGLDWQGIASRLGDTSSSQSQAVVGSANLLTAAICRLTGNQPADICSSSGVQEAAGLLK